MLIGFIGEPGRQEAKPEPKPAWGFWRVFWISFGSVVVSVQLAAVAWGIVYMRRRERADRGQAKREAVILPMAAPASHATEWGSRWR